ncbi:hypothetical protein LOC67_19155 [Stieleria sp. JC731]|uniref:hypothetical protein n=1 Tax=Pirellulaceae TaxID=2691357 RepID=UPI001E634C88|nr:hypothetical protein [Stieleria sp. JC731]MCC9602674.1 hypothetical protein [Stieleria sp. JC731]
MSAQQPQSEPQPEAHYEPQIDGDGADEKAADISGFELSKNQQLLNDVLGETLARHQEDSTSLIDALVRLRQTRVDQPCDELLFVEIARQVLEHRLGERCARLPRDCFAEVGKAFWNNDQSRHRIQHFWSTLGADN